MQYEVALCDVVVWESLNILKRVFLLLSTVDLTIGYKMKYNDRLTAWTSQRGSDAPNFNQSDASPSVKRRE